MRLRRMVRVGMLCFVLALPFSAKAATSCDRACLEGFANGYIAAALAHDVAKLPLAADAKVAENNIAITPGEGSFATLSGQGKYRHYFADPATGSVGLITTVTEHGAKGILDLRMRVTDGKIAEIETLMIRDAGGHDRYEALAAPEQPWLDVVPSEKRLSRAEMVRAVNHYFSYMTHNDGRGDYTFFDDECDRLEHALKTTNVRQREAYGHSSDTNFSSLTCAQQQETGFLGFVTEIRNRRFFILDEERQVVLAAVTLDHNGTIRKLPQKNGSVFVLPPYFNVPRTLQVYEAFKLRGEKLYRIEMTLVETPYGNRPPWQDGADIMVIK